MDNCSLKDDRTPSTASERTEFFLRRNDPHFGLPSAGSNAPRVQCTPFQVMPHAYGKHVETEFQIALAKSDPEVHRAGQAATASTLGEVIALTPPRDGPAGKESRTIDPGLPA